MTVDEVSQLIAYMASLWPTFKANITDADATLAAWSMALQPYKADKIWAALQAYIATSGSKYAPGVSELIALTFTRQSTQQMSDAEAWGLVYKAICRSNYYSEEEFEKLPKTIQRAVGSPAQLRQWAGTCCEDVETVIGSNFKKSFRAAQMQELEIMKMPPAVRERLGVTTQIALTGGQA